MTWAKAVPVLVLALVFDALRLFFEMFWFFGPAIAALYCTDAASSWVGSLWGLTAAACTTVAALAGAYASPATTAFGVVMAIAVGLIGWMTLGLILIMTNARMFKENAGNTLWFVGSLLVSETPLLGAVPALTGSLARLYSVQIKKEKAVFRAYQKEEADRQVKERQEQAARATQARNAQIAEAQNQEISDYTQYAEEPANDEQYDQVQGDTRKPAYEINAEAANDDSYIPQDNQKSA
ncbi:MAG: hypothetical protein WAV50_02755 [Minisyncoccia bacterium]